MSVFSLVTNKQQMNLTQINIQYFFNTNFNIVISSRSKSPSGFSIEDVQLKS
jgi:hypothetical protein